MSRRPEERRPGRREDRVVEANARLHVLGHAVASVPRRKVKDHRPGFSFAVTTAALKVAIVACYDGVLCMVPLPEWSQLNSEIEKFGWEQEQTLHDLLVADIPRGMPFMAQVKREGGQLQIRAHRDSLPACPKLPPLAECDGLVEARPGNPILEEAAQRQEEQRQKRLARREQRRQEALARRQREAEKRAAIAAEKAEEAEKAKEEAAKAAEEAEAEARRVAEEDDERELLRMVREEEETQAAEEAAEKELTPEEGMAPEGMGDADMPPDLVAAADKVAEELKQDEPINTDQSVVEENNEPVDEESADGEEPEDQQ